MKRIVLAAAFAALVPAASQAVVVYDTYDNYNDASSSYGHGVGGASFTQYTSNYDAGGCFGYAAFACKTSGANNDVPSAGINTSGATLIGVAGSVDVPTGLLFQHPGAGDDAIFNFTASTAGYYKTSGLFQRLDRVTSGTNDPGNDGVVVSIFKTTTTGSSLLYTSSALAGYGLTQNATTSFGLDQFSLAAGDQISYVVNRNAVYYNDSTGLKATISAVPESSTWAMMIGGFGMVGAGMRQRRRRAAIA